MSRKKKYNPSGFSELYNPKINKYKFICSLKNNGYSSFVQNIKKAYKHPLTKRYVNGNYKPKSYEDIRNQSQFFYSKNLGGEFAWILESLKEHFELINKFVGLEKKLEKNILLGNIDKAIIIINEINVEFGYSYWALEIEYYLLELNEGTEGNWKRKNSLNEKITNRYSLFLNQIFSKKSEQGYSSKDYHRSLYNEIRKTTEYDFELLNFRLAFHLAPKYKHFSFFLFADSSSSLLDRYFSVINTLTELINDKENSELVTKIISKLNEKIRDSRIERLCEFIGINIVEKKGVLEIYDLLDEFSFGNYSLCIEKIPIILLENPNHIELWDIYIKSLVETKSKFIKTNISDYLDKILEDIYSIYSLNGNVIEVSNSVLKTINSIPNFKFSKQLLSIIKFPQEFRIDTSQLKVIFSINSNFANPLLPNISKKAVPSNDIKNSITYKCLDYIMGNGTIPDKSRISAFKIILYSMRKNYNNGEFEECIRLGKEIDLNHFQENIYLEEITFIFYESLVRKELNDEAIDLYVNTYFRNENLLSRINTESVINNIIDADYNMSGSLNSAVFFVLENLDYYYQFVGIEMWLESINIEYPSQLNIENYSEKNEKLTLILDQGCKIEVLEKFYNLFDSKEDVINERKKILKILLQTEKNNFDRFIDELSSIAQKEKIQTVLSEVNSGRIRLSNDMLNSSTDNNFDNNYKRYRLISDFAITNDSLVYDSKKLLADLFESTFDEKTESLDPSFYSFKILVNEMVDSFLFNKKNGLDGDLSTRIRHGELENQLRSVFDKYHLISKKDEQDRYEDITYWGTLLKNTCTKNEIDNIQRILKEFSQKIDNKIQFLVKNQIQVISENYQTNKYSFFDYYLTDSYLKFLYKDSNHRIDQYEEFKDYIFTELKARTDLILKDIRIYFNGHFKEGLDNDLETLKTALLSILNKQSTFELPQNITDAKVDIQNQINNITGWFTVSDSKIDKSMDINTIIQTSFESHNIKHPNFPITPKIKASEKIFIYDYKHYVFIIFNLIDNIRIHCKLNSDQLKVDMSADYENDTLTFSVKNNFHKSLVNEKELKNKFTLIKNNWNNEVNHKSINKEGGTGFEKIKRILFYDIKSVNNQFDFIINSNYLEIIFKINITHKFKING